MVTKFSPIVLQAALRRGGVWVVAVCGTPTYFYHRACFPHQPPKVAK